MRARVAAFVAIALLAVGPTGTAAATGAVAPGVVQFRITDARLTELSGLALGHRSPDVLYAQNDSGDSARFFALDRTSGRVRAVCTVPGASNVDWEDLATGRDTDGVDSVWLADIGDNGRARGEVRIYRVDEPAIGQAAELATNRPDVWRLRYPDGPHDAESLVADPVRHRLYVVTKELLGHSEVFEVPAAPDPSRVRPMTRIGTVDFSFTGTPGGPNPIGQLTATGATSSADGTELAIRTYTDAYLWRVSGGDVAAALRRRPVRVPLPPQPQGEGIAFDGADLLLDGEGVGTAVYRLPIPALPASTAAPRSAASAATPTSAGQHPVSAGHRPAHRQKYWVALLGGLGGAMALAGVAIGRRRR